MPTFIEYIGSKPVKTDNVAGTNTVWHGQGDVQSVPDAAVPALLKHPGVWRKVDAPAPTGGLADAASAPQVPEDGDLSGLDDTALRALVRAQDLDVDCRKRGDALRAAVTEALKAKG